MRHAVLLALLIATTLTSGTLEGQSGRVSLSFSTNVLDVGTPAVIDLLIDCQEESCAAADIRVQYDPQALRINGVTLGEFPTKNGNHAFLLDQPLDETGAMFTLRYVTLDDTYTASAGMGVLAHITVTALAEGLTELQIARASIAPLNGEMVFTPQTQVGTVLVRPVYALRTLSVRAEASAPNQVTVSAPDAPTEIVSETLAGDALLVEVKYVPDTAIELEIDAPGHLACRIAGDQSREITLLAGDVNDDDIIDSQDADTLANALSGNPEAESDVNHDGVVDIFDLIHVGRNYGLSTGECKS